MDTNKHLEEAWLGVLDEYQVNEHNIITQPGKLEAEWLPTAYFWELTLHGIEDEIFYDGDRPNSIFELETHRDIIPMLSEEDETHVVLWENNHGFVFAIYTSAKQVEVWKEMCESED